MRKSSIPSQRSNQHPGTRQVRVLAVGRRGNCADCGNARSATVTYQDPATGQRRTMTVWCPSCQLQAR